jgi:hypothetical protein
MTAIKKSVSPKQKRNLEYSPHLISYIDILGFRELVAEKSPNFISKAIRRVIETTAPDAQVMKKNHENYINFSDLIVHTVPIFSSANKKFPDGLVFWEINHLALAQISLIDEGLLLRGAVTIGMLERTYGVLFGPGIISAYELEREQAQFPRIVVDSDLIKAVKTNPLLRAHPYEEEMKYISKFIKMDDDGVSFIDYLGGMQDEVREPEDYFGVLETHKEFVEKNIAKFKENRRVLSKYLWLKKYHNAVVQARLKPDVHEDLLVRVSNCTADVPPLIPAFRPLDEESSDDLD